jgi:hypothetical protein
MIANLDGRSLRGPSGSDNWLMATLIEEIPLAKDSHGVKRFASCSPTVLVVAMP